MNDVNDYIFYIKNLIVVQKLRATGDYPEENTFTPASFLKNHSCLIYRR